MPDFYQRLEKISTFVFDVDGVFTDSRLLLTEDGQLLRTMNVRDGYAVKVALQEGFHIHIITGGSSAGVITRLKGLGIEDIHSGIRDKRTVIQKIMVDRGLDSSEVAYMGDDEIDIPCFREVGIACAPKDADPSALSSAEWVAARNGGDGCVRELIQMVLQAQNKWTQLV